MQDEDWTTISRIGIALGFIFIVGALVAYNYYEYFTFYYPYRDYAIPLAIVGVILLVVGIVVSTRERDRRPTPDIPKSNYQKYQYCRSCG